MVMEPSCKISLCIFSFILFWIYCLDFYHIYVHIKAQLFIVKANLQSMSFSIFCLPRLGVWSCSFASIRAWFTLSSLSPGSPFYKEAVCPWPWPWCMMKTACDIDFYIFWRQTGDVYLCSCWGRANCHPFKSPWSPVKDNWRGWKGVEVWEGEWQKTANKCIRKRPSHGIPGQRLDWALLIWECEELQGLSELLSFTQGRVHG